MAEPLSVAASAAGLLAIGIESCKILVAYYDGFRGLDTDIDNLKIKSEGLLDTLQIIDSLLSKPATSLAIDPAIAADINTKILASEKWINKIQSRFAEWSVVSQRTSIGGKIRTTGKRAMYPLRRETLLDTLKILEGLQTNLHTALLALQIQDASTLAKQTDMIRTVQNFSTTMLTRMQQYETSLSKMVPASLAEPCNAY
ncbi:hypothetical protein ASPCAL11269 [Aspergillus calidoustus]|uniref:Fungal N-terminal domain-containing protein n=1 Tax=Aspergillus calidoustus TaxID=454130 RepID=A0A0U5H2Q0_ASPCI|nr:hypothetical protein ASPCAL11269 [Aspergillus calidoustus]